jgi:polyisoprenoid-binding protein YceI
MAQEARSVQGVDLPPAGAYGIDRAHSSVEFVARHMISRVRGRFTDFDGAVTVGDAPEDSHVEVEVATASVQTNEERRDQHLRSADFFESERHPSMTFRSTALRPVGGDRFELDGELTIRDVTRPITLVGTFDGWGPNLEGVPFFAASARASIDREDWGLTWNAAVETGGFLVGKKVDIEISIEAAKTA